MTAAQGWAEPAALSAAAWLCTYALHSTALLGAAALLARGPVRSPAARALLWKAALLGGVLTASAQAAGLGGPALRWSPPREGAAATRTPSGPAGEGAPRGAHASPAATRSAPGSARGGGDPASGTRAWSLASGSRPGSAAGWAVGLLAVWAAGAAASAARVLRANRRAVRAMGSRTPLGAGAARDAFDAVVRATGSRRRFRLTVGCGASSPAALPGGEVCVPARFARDLAPDEQHACLAHEVAHLLRRDPEWALAAAGLRTVFWFQPLNGVAQRGLRDAAELLADDAAARLGASRLALARCLVRVGGWMAGPRPVASAAAATSPLRARVDRLLRPAPDPAAPRQGLVLAVAAALLVAAQAAPGFAAGPESQDAPAEPGRPAPAAPVVQAPRAAPAPVPRTAATASRTAPASPRPTASAAGATQEGTFVLLAGGAVVATERFRRGQGELRGEIRNHRAEGVTYRAALGPEATVTRLDAREHARPGEAAEGSVITFGSGEVVATARDGGRQDTLRRAAPAGTLPFINPSVAQMEQIVRRGRAVGGDSVEVPLFVAGGGGRLGTARVRFPAPGRARLFLSHPDGRRADVWLEVDSAGSVLGGSVPGQGLRIERRTGPAAPSIPPLRAGPAAGAATHSRAPRSAGRLHRSPPPAEDP